jgi:broad specificity phosphatase PhoE
LPIADQGCRSAGARSGVAGVNPHCSPIVPPLNQAIQPSHTTKPCNQAIKPYPCQKTAEIIGKYLNLKIKFTDLLKERKNPSEIIGRPSDDLKVKAITDLIDKSYHEDDLRISDEENFIDLKKRAKKLMGFIESRWQKRIIMVTHSRFLKFFIAYMIYRDKLTASEYNTLSFFNTVKNGDMAICKYTHHWFKKDEWELLAWNDLD